MSVFSAGFELNNRRRRGNPTVGGAPTMLLNLLNSSSLDPRVTFSRGTNAMLIDSTGQLTYAPNNMLLNSDNFNVITSWVPFGTVTVSSNVAVAPDNTTTADSITIATSSGIYQNRSAVVGVNYSLSIWLKADSPVTVRLSSNTDTSVVASTSCSVTTVWQRFSLVRVCPVGATTVSLQLDQAAGVTVYAWGAQLGAVTYETAPRTYNSTTPKNLLGRTEEFDNASWNRLGINSLTVNATTDPNGFLNADKIVEDLTTGEHYIDQNFAIVTGNIYTFSSYLKAGERNQVILRFTSAGSWSGGSVQVLFTLTGSGSSSLISGSPLTTSITAVGNGWYRCSISALTIASVSPSARLQMYNGSTNSYAGDGVSGFYAWGAQVSDSASLDPYVYNPAAALTSTAYYGPRFDYSPTTLAPLGLLIEEARTNLLLYSDQLDVAATWPSANIDVTANAIVSPDGTTNADAIIEKTTPTVFHYINQSVTKAASAIQYAASFYVKNKGRDIVINIQSSSANGVIARINPETGNIASGIAAFGTGWTAGSLTTTSVGDGWYKVVMVATSDTATTAQFQCSLYNAVLATNIYTGDGVSGVYIWGAQLEAGSFATSYIPTAGASVTRSADVATMVGNNFSNWYNQTTGTLAVSFDASANSNATYVSASNGTITQNSLHIDNDTGNMRAVYYSGSTLITALGLGSIGTVGTSNKIATAYAVNDFAASRNGGTVATFTSPGAVPVSLTQLNIGTDDRLVAPYYTNGHIKTISYYNTRLTNTQLQAIST